MCLGRPARVLAVEEQHALVEIDGRPLKVLTLLVPDITPGDDALVAGGLIVARLQPGEAQERRRLFEQMIELASEAPVSGRTKSKP